MKDSWILPNDLSTIGGGGLPEELELPEELDPENEELEEEFVTGIFPLSGSLNPEEEEFSSGLFFEVEFFEVEDFLGINGGGGFDDFEDELLLEVFEGRRSTFLSPFDVETKTCGSEF